MVTDAENPEIRKLWVALETALNDEFVKSATPNGVGRWETILNIVPKGTDKLDERKFRILTRLNEQLPYSWRMLAQQLSTLCGQDGYTMQLKNEEYTLTVKVALIAKANFSDVDDLLHRIVPANMIIDLSLLYNQFDTLTKFVHDYLSAYTFDQLRDEVIT